MRIGGIQPCSCIDYPGEVTAIIFTIGCNFRCPYCHNPELVDETAEEISLKEVMDFLRSRQHLLDAVTVTGGEPTVHEDLVSFLRDIKSLGFKIKLDTNGTRPDVIEAVSKEKLVDYLAMDIKAPLPKYGGIVARPVDTSAIKTSIDIIINGPIDYEFRTTVVKCLLSPADIEGIGKDIEGAKTYYLQKFVPSKLLNPGFIRKTTYSDQEFSELQSIAAKYVERCAVR